MVVSSELGSRHSPKPSRAMSSIRVPATCSVSHCDDTQHYWFIEMRMPTRFGQFRNQFRMPKRGAKGKSGTTWCLFIKHQSSVSRCGAYNELVLAPEDHSVDHKLAQRN
jgi:hypothetical protein